MIHETIKMNDLKVQTVEFDLEPYLTEHIRDDELAEDIRSADVVLLPYSEFREVKGPIFSEAAVEFYQFLKRKLNEKNIEICVEEDDYKEIALHDEAISLGVILLNGIILPIIVNIIFEYIQSRRGKRKVNVKVTFIQKEENNYKEFKYEGDSEDLVDTMETFLKKRDANEC